jgi:glycosyltransferase involved in cell wall biosynthesis
MPDPNHVTVAVCTWNRCESLRRTLDAMTRLRVPAGVSWELIVVNNNCTDDTDRVCGEFSTRLPLRLLHETTPGQSFARNLAIREATGARIAWTDDDVLVDPGWLARLDECLTTWGADWVFGPSEPEWPGPPPSWYSKRLCGYFAVLDYGAEPFVVTTSEHPFYGLNFAGTREAHVALSGFRQDYGLKGHGGGGVGEDIDLFLRALAAGMKIVYAPDARVRHIIPEDRARKQFHRRRLWATREATYRHLPEVFPQASWLLGLPRFFYPYMFRDAVEYVRNAMTGRQSERFYHELRLVKFGSFAIESARHGFQKPPMPQPQSPRSVSAHAAGGPDR